MPFLFFENKKCLKFLSILYKMIDSIIKNFVFDLTTKLRSKLLAFRFTEYYQTTAVFQN